MADVAAATALAVRSMAECSDDNLSDVQTWAWGWDDGEGVDGEEDDTGEPGHDGGPHPPPPEPQQLLSDKQNRVHGMWERWCRGKKFKQEPELDETHWAPWGDKGEVFDVRIYGRAEAVQKQPP